jgi:hypothetical protein
MLDERFETHRFKATRLALTVGMIAMVVLFCFEMFANRVVRWDLLVVLLVVALTKIFAMLYYQRTN